MDGSNRKLAAIMFTDMVGFSRKMGADEVLAMAMLLIHDRILAETIASHQGRVLKKMGDAFFAEFGSAVSAVQCAVAIQTALKEHNTVSKPDEQIVIRIGIHLGDVVVQGEDLYGEGVNVAARLEPLAEPGGICLSQAIYQAVKSQSSVEAVHVGEVELKNILEKYVVYRIPPLYAVEQKGESHATQSTASGELRFKVKSVGARPLVGRSRWLYIIKWTLMYHFASIFPIFPIIIADSTFESNSYIERHYLSWAKIDDQQGFINKFRAPTDSLSAFLRSQFHAKVSRQLDNYDGGEKIPYRLIDNLYSELNAIVWTRSIVWKIHESYGLNPELLERYNRELNDPNDSLAISARYRLLWDCYKNNLRMRTYSESTIDNWVQALGLLSTWVTFFVETVIIFLFLFFISSPTSMLITFSDLRGVDQGVTFLTSEMRFRRRRQDARGILFRRWGFLGSIFQNLGGMRVRVDGNTILLTSSNIVIQRAKKLFKMHLSDN